MKKAMLSQPMAGETEEEIISTREKAVKTLEESGMSCSVFLQGLGKCKGLQD